MLSLLDPLAAAAHINVAERALPRGRPESRVECLLSFFFFSHSALILQTHVNFVGPMWLGCFMAIAGLYSVDHKMQYHPSCD